MSTKRANFVISDFYCFFQKTNDWLIEIDYVCFYIPPVAGVVNRGDSFRRRRSRSNSLAPAELEDEVKPSSPPKEVASYTVGMLGARGVGKTALISQFMTSECINAYDRQRGESQIKIEIQKMKTKFFFVNKKDNYLIRYVWFHRFLILESFCVFFVEVTNSTKYY